MLRHYEECVRRGVPCIIPSDDYCDLAEYYDRKGRTKEAKAVLNTAIKLFPDTLEPVTMRARLSMHESGTTRWARRLLAKVTDKNDIEYVCTMAEILIREGKMDTLDTFLCDHEQRLKADSFATDKPAPDEISDYDDFCMQVAETLIDFNLSERARQWAERVSDKTTTDYKEMLGRLLMCGEQYEECEQEMNKLLDQDPFSTDYWNTLALSQFLRGDISQSISSCEYALAIDPSDYVALRNCGNGLLMLGNYEEALKCYQRHTQLQPDDAIGYLFQALCYLNMGDVDEARKLTNVGLKKQLTWSHDLCSLMIEIAETFARMGHSDDAFAYIDEVEMLAVSDDKMRSFLNVTKGYIHLTNGDGYKARDLFINALEETGDDPDVIIRIVEALIDNGLVETAYAMLKRLFSLCDMKHEKATQSAVYNECYAYMALCCHALKKKREFVSNVKKAVTANSARAKDILQGIFPDDIAPEDYPGLAKDMNL